MKGEVTFVGIVYGVPDCLESMMEASTREELLAHACARQVFVDHRGVKYLNWGDAQIDGEVREDNDRIVVTTELYAAMAGEMNKTREDAIVAEVASARKIIANLTKAIAHVEKLLAEKP